MGSVAMKRRRRTASSDAALIDRARSGDLEAYGQLFERHSGSARALARQLNGSGGEADDAVSEAFERVLGAIRRGTGPRDSFRPYLLTTVRRTTYDRSRREQRTGPTADEWVLDRGVEDPDPSLAAFERKAMARAFESLPERWQTVLWHTEVEETPPDDLAVILGVRPNALAALAYRAREGLRQAYVLAHVDIDLCGPTSDCRWTIDRLPKYVRGRVSDEVELKLELHLDGCSECRAFYFEMADVGVSLRAALVPLVFGGPAALAAVKAISGAGAGVAGVASIAGISAGGAATTGAVVAGSGAAAVGTGSVVAGVAAATVAATVGGALVLPSVTTLVSDPAPSPVVAEAYGRKIAGLTEPVVISVAPVVRAAVVPAVVAEPEAVADVIVVAAPAPTSEVPPVDASVADPVAPAEEGEDPGDPGPADDPDDGQLGDDLLVGDIGVPLVITPPVPSNPLDIIELEEEPVTILPPLSDETGLDETGLDETGLDETVPTDSTVPEDGPSTDEETVLAEETAPLDGTGPADEDESSSADTSDGPGNSGSAPGKGSTVMPPDAGTPVEGDKADGDGIDDPAAE